MPVIVVTYHHDAAKNAGAAHASGNGIHVGKRDESPIFRRDCVNRKKGKEKRERCIDAIERGTKTVVNGKLGSCRPTPSTRRGKCALLAAKWSRLVGAWINLAGEH